jgi:hypothetical protein
MITTLRLPNGWFCLAQAIPMHRRIPGRRYPYARVTHWLAIGGEKIGAGRTRREAMANLKSLLGIATIKEEHALKKALN